MVKNFRLLNSTVLIFAMALFLLADGPCQPGSNTFVIGTPGNSSVNAGLTRSVNHPSKTDNSLYEKTKNISVDVKNSTGKTVYVVCFAYIQKRALLSLWRMTKSSILTLDEGHTGQINMECPAVTEVYNSVYGYLGVFDTLQEAQDSTFELMDDRKKLDLDLMYKLGKNVVDLKIDKISAEKALLEYEFEDKGKKPNRKDWNNLNFYVQNQAGKPLLVVAFMYKQAEGEIRDTVWEYKKTEPFLLQCDETAMVKLESIKSKDDASYVRGILALFDPEQEEEAKTITYQMLGSQNVVELDRLHNIAGKKIILKVQKYGLKGDFVDFIVKKAQAPPGDQPLYKRTLKHH